MNGKGSDRTQRIRDLARENSRRRLVQEVTPQLKALFGNEFELHKPQSQHSPHDAFEASYRQASKHPENILHFKWNENQIEEVEKFMISLGLVLPDCISHAFLLLSGIGILKVRLRHLLPVATKVAALDENVLSVYEPESGSGLVVALHKHFHGGKHTLSTWELELWGIEWIRVVEHSALC